MDDYGWVVGIVVAIVVMVVFLGIEGNRSCEHCGAPLPRMRLPRNWRQLIRGGWTCPRCGMELDREGHPIL